MNIIIWVVQILLALWNIIGAAYMLNHFDVLANAWALGTLPQPFWIVLGVLQILFSLGLALSGAVKSFPKLASFSALGLAAISLLGPVLYASYTGLGALWAVIPAMLAFFMAYKRWPRKIV